MMTNLSPFQTDNHIAGNSLTIYRIFSDLKLPHELYVFAEIRHGMPHTIMTICDKDNHIQICPALIC